MPPRAISPRSWSRARRSDGSGVSADEGRTTGPGPVNGSVSRKCTRGMCGRVPVNVASALGADVAANDDAPSAVASRTSCESWSSSAGAPPARPARSRQAGHNPPGASAGRFSPQSRQRSRSSIVDPPRRAAGWSALPLLHSNEPAGGRHVGRGCRTEARKGHWYPTFLCGTVHSVQPPGGAEQVKRISRVRRRLMRKMRSYLPAPIAALNLSRWNCSLSK